MHKYYMHVFAACDTYVNKTFFLEQPPNQLLSTQTSVCSSLKQGIFNKLKNQFPTYSKKQRQL